MRDEPRIVILTSYVGADSNGLGSLTGVEIDGAVIERNLEMETEEAFLDRVTNESRKYGVGTVVIQERRERRR
jgi:hypothetical protein